MPVIKQSLRAIDSVEVCVIMLSAGRTHALRRRSTHGFVALASSLPSRLTVSPETPTKARGNDSETPYQVQNLRAHLLWKLAWRRLQGPLVLFRLCRELRLYGTSSALKDQENQYKRNVERFLQRLRTSKKEHEGVRLCFILLPSSPLIKVWNLLLFLLMLYTAVVMPYRIAFSSTEVYSAWYFVELTVDILFAQDLAINFISAYENDDGDLEVKWSRIAWHYLCGWFVFDFIACFPFSVVDNSGSSDNQQYSQSYNSLVRLVRLPRLYRLVRITRLLKILKHARNNDIVERLQDFLQINTSLMRILSFAVTVMMLVHIVGCLWYFIAKLEGLGPDSWVVRAGLGDQPEASQYIASVYWAFTTLATVGYGDIAAGTDMERIFSIIWMLFGIGFYSFTIGSLTSMLSDLDSRNNELTVKLNAVDQIAREARLGSSVKFRLRRAIRLHMKKTELDSGDKQLMFDSLPKKLRYQVSMNMYDQASERIPFFQKRSPEFISTIIPYLRYMFVEADEYVYRKNDDSDEIYFILNGRVALVTGFLQTVFKTMLEGSYYGDVELLLKEKRLCTSKVECDTELLVMPKPVRTSQMVRYIAEDFPEVFAEMMTLAEKRRTKILETKAEVDCEMVRIDQQAELEALKDKRFSRLNSRLSSEKSFKKA